MARLMQIFFMIVGGVWALACVGGLILFMTKGALTEKHLLMLFVAMPAIAGAVITGLVMISHQGGKNEN